MQKRGVICWTWSTCSDGAIPFFGVITHLHTEEVRSSLQLPSCHSQSAGKQLELSVSPHVSPSEKLTHDGDDDDDDDDRLTERMRGMFTFLAPVCFKSLSLSLSLYALSL